MTDRILIPIDMSSGSLATLKLTLASGVHGQADYILMFSLKLSDSISNLLFYRKENLLKENYNQDFEDTLAFIKNRFESAAKSIQVDFFHGRTSAAFRNFCEKKSITHIYIPEGINLGLRKGTFDPCPLIIQSGLPYKTVQLSPNELNFKTTRLGSLH